MLFSATQTRKTEDLARLSLKKEPIYVGVDDDKIAATVDGLEQVGETYSFQRFSRDHINLYGFSFSICQRLVPVK